MRRNRKATSSDLVTVSLTVPKSWAELDEKQLRHVFKLVAQETTTTELKLLCMMQWNKLKLVCHHGKGYIMKHRRQEFYVDAETLVSALKFLEYLGELPQPPVRYERLGRHRAADPLLQGLGFGIYLYCENLYQGWLMTQDTELLEQIGQLLYNCPKRRLKPHERYMVFYWWAAVKDRFAKEFRHFFVTSQEGDGNLLGQGDISTRLKDGTNAQIRALTKGDVTKEKEIMAMDVWRALTELDALAKEYEEIKRKYGKS